MPIVPHNIFAFDNGNQMASILGSFWSVWFGEKDFVEDLMTADGSAYFQTYMDTLDLVNTKSRLNVPVFQRKYWSLLTALESEKDDYTGSEYQYGDTDVINYTKSLIPAYGDNKKFRYYAYPIDSSIVSVASVYNRVIDPSLAWANGVDFILDTDRSLIMFLEDPFENDLVPKVDVRDATTGAVTDRKLALWLNMSEWDQEYIYEQFGYAMGVWMESTEFYREFISAMWDSLLIGPTRSVLKSALSAISGIPFARDAETVVDISQTATSTIIATSVNVYTFKPTVQVSVAVGDVLEAGDSLCTAVALIEPGPNTDWSTIAGLALGPTLMGKTTSIHPVTIENKSVDVVHAGYDEEGRAVVRFDVSGFASDVEEFWTQAHDAGILLNNTVADLLDTRAVRDGPTLPADLPATINPFQFFMDNLFENNLYVIRLRPADFADGAPGLAALDALAQYTAPYTTYIAFVEIDDVSDSYEISSTDSVVFNKGVYNTDSITDFASDTGPTIRAIARSCR